MLRSYLNLNTSLSLEKCDYFCRNYLKQIIKYLETVVESITTNPPTPGNSNQMIAIDSGNSNNAPTAPLDTDDFNKTSDMNPNHMANVTRFISELLEILQK